LVFEGDTPMKMFLEHLQAQPIPPSRRTEMPIPPELDALVLACLEKDPANRPQNARELLRMMERIGASQNWTNDHARAWWDTHLLDLTGPLALSEVPTMPASREVAMV
jgi:serine/threonine-protein kinase